MDPNKETKPYVQKGHGIPEGNDHEGEHMGFNIRMGQKKR